MRAPIPRAETALLAEHFERAAGHEEALALGASFSEATSDVVEAVLDQAARFSFEELNPLNDEADQRGPCIVDGRVRTAKGHRDTWQTFRESGLGTIDQPQTWGGQGLPRSLAIMVQEILDRTCPAFGMLPVPQRSAARLIGTYGSEAMKEEWLSRLISGEWGATICISEEGAGSDLSRIRTRAEGSSADGWRIHGEKCWISSGDHDLTDRIGHCLLARTDTSEGLSLFLVPNFNADGSANGVRVRRIEEKLGLHLSPTCALGFEGARAELIGEEGRGLQQMFVMITNMRLATGVQGLASAAAALDLAIGYAQERRQGGRAEQAVPIIEHADVQRQIMSMAGRVECLRSLCLSLANYADIADHSPDENRRAEAQNLVQWMLPIVKTKGGEIGFDVASDALQIFGGAGYTREWPVEQLLRDTRVLTIFEGTTGMQAQDLLFRRILGRGGEGADAFVALARETAAPVNGIAKDQFLGVLALLEQAITSLRSGAHDQRALETAATPVLHLASLATLGWAGLRLIAQDQRSGKDTRLGLSAQAFLRESAEQAAGLASAIDAGRAAIAGVEAIVGEAGGQKQ